MAHAELRGVVALDGPSGTGKSTVARQLASILDADYLDTGAMYRTVTLAVLRANVALSDAHEVMAIVERSRLEMGTDPEHPHVSLDGEDVSAAIRDHEVTSAVSEVSAVPELRAWLVAKQQEKVRSALRSRRGIVVEGRDIGTVVTPDAELKVYLTAAPEIRARRRHGQDAAAGRSGDLVESLADLCRRDTLDSGRSVAPLQMAEDAVELDTTDVDVPAVLASLVEVLTSRGLLSDVERTVR